MPQAMRPIVKAFRRPPTGRIRDRNGGLPRLLAKGGGQRRARFAMPRTRLGEASGGARVATAHASGRKPW